MTTRLAFPAKTANTLALTHPNEGKDLMLKWFVVLAILLAVPLSAFFRPVIPVPPAPPEYSKLTDYVHLILGEEEMWIPNYPRITGYGPHPPSRANFGMGIEPVSRPDRQGEPIRFYPLITPPPYYVDSIMISSSGGDWRGFYEILGSTGELDQLRGITNILVTRNYDSDRELRRLYDNSELYYPAPSSYPDFTLLGRQNSDMDTFRTNKLQLFGQYLEGGCGRYAPSAPEGYFCTLDGRLPDLSWIRIMINVNFQDRESWENFDIASETWPPRLAALERLILSFYQAPAP